MDAKGSPKVCRFMIAFALLTPFGIVACSRTPISNPTADPPFQKQVREDGLERYGKQLEDKLRTKFPGAEMLDERVKVEFYANAKDNKTYLFLVEVDVENVARSKNLRGNLVRFSFQAWYDIKGNFLEMGWDDHLGWTQAQYEAAKANNGNGTQAGYGKKPGGTTGPVRCSYCNGVGTVKCKHEQLEGGIIPVGCRGGKLLDFAGDVHGPCSACQATGFVRCKTCNGAGNILLP